MQTRITALLLLALASLAASAQKPKVYDEAIDPMAQIDEAVAAAAQSGRNVVCQVGGNWCRWCLMFADLIASDPDIADEISDNYVYIHVNYPRSGDAGPLMRRLGNPGRFGYPALVVLSPQGKVLHIQDSGYLEDGNGYDKDKVLRFFKNWAPAYTAETPE